MKFSILLPTRNGAPYIRETIASVLHQDYEDMELIISDNASNPDTQSIISEYSSDSRLRCIRQDAVVSVTENWNSALGAGRGDYLVMIGDDDCLMPKFFEVLDAALKRHDSPDCITYNGFSFVYPGSVDGNVEAYFAPYHFQFGKNFQCERELSKEMRQHLVRDMYAFRVRFPLNMQLTLFSRRAAKQVRGGTFRPPFPDHYALMSLLLLADRFVFIPDRLVVVGVSPKSFGHYYYSGQTTAGARYLGLTAADDGRLPGSELLNCMRQWLALVKSEYPDFLNSTHISRWNYVGRQVYHWSRQYEFGKLSWQQLRQYAQLVSWIDWTSFVAPLVVYRGILKVARNVGLRHGTMFTEMWPALRPLPDVRSIAEFVAWVGAQEVDLDEPKPCQS